MEIKSTTILSVRKAGRVAMGGDGQVTLGQTIMKANAQKIRPVYNGRILTGFAGATADALTLVGKFELKLDEYRGNLKRASIELAKEWRSDKFLRRLDALLGVVDADSSFILSGTGDIIEPEDGILGIGSGAPYAIAAARALFKHSELDAKKIVEVSLRIASDICIYTNGEIKIETIGYE